MKHNTPALLWSWAQASLATLTSRIHSARDLAVDVPVRPRDGRRRAVDGLRAQVPRDLQRGLRQLQARIPGDLRGARDQSGKGKLQTEQNMT